MSTMSGDAMQVPLAKNTSVTAVIHQHGPDQSIQNSTAQPAEFTLTSADAENAPHYWPVKDEWVQVC